MDHDFAPHRPPHDPDALDARLIALVTSAWSVGWMPGDLIAAAHHTSGSSATRLVAALIQREHDEQQYGDRLSPVWQRQMAEARELAADPAAAIEARRRGWRDDRLELWSLLAFLPGIQHLGPLPGEAQPDAARPDGRLTADADPVDPDALRKVRALLAKAESSSFDAEAEAFTAKAQALIADYSLADALRHGVEGDTTDGPTSSRLAVQRPYGREKFGLLSVVARANRCQAILHDGLGLATIIGYPVDLEAADLLFTSLLVQATKAIQRHGSTVDDYGRSTTKAFRRSFLIGFSGRIGERLTAETEQATSAAATETASLLPVLAGRAELVERAVGDAFPRLSSMRSSRATFDGSGYSAGVTAADRASLATRRPLAS